MLSIQRIIKTKSKLNGIWYVILIIDSRITIKYSHNPFLVSDIVPGLLCIWFHLLLTTILKNKNIIILSIHVRKLTFRKVKKFA
jgi:hypothetical protein